MNNKVMHGDVLSPLVSSNMVDKNISKPAIETGNIYMYKNKVVIPPLHLQLVHVVSKQEKLQTS